MQIEFKDKIADLNQGDFIIVPKGVMHRPICIELVKALIIEKTGTLTKDNTGGTYQE
jgi:mannose-6-phosphate isomerase-like protein (cupin superfamily)